VLAVLFVLVIVFNDLVKERSESSV
jgi:hypothetical protein